jgi:hypothetical protein
VPSRRRGGSGLFFAFGELPFREAGALRGGSAPFDCGQAGWGRSGSSGKHALCLARGCGLPSNCWTPNRPQQQAAGLSVRLAREIQKSAGLRRASLFGSVACYVVRKSATVSDTTASEPCCTRIFDISGPTPRLCWYSIARTKSLPQVLGDYVWRAPTPPWRT